MSLDDLIRRFMEDPESDDESKDNVRSLMDSHLASGMNLQNQGLIREAIGEFEKEHHRAPDSAIDREILQASYWHTGRAYRLLGEIDNAISDLRSAQTLWNTYQLGVSPHYDLAEILIELERYDDAIEVCHDLLDRHEDPGMRVIMEKALALKKKKRVD